MAEPTKPMRDEAVKAGYYTSRRKAQVFRNAKY